MRLDKPQYGFRMLGPKPGACSLKARARRRATQRGAALVEACVVIPVFVILLAGMLFLHQVVQKTQQSQLAARNRAWTAAMKSCEGGDEITQPDLTSRMDTAPGSSVSLTATSGEATGTKSDTASVTMLGSGPAAVAQSSVGGSFSQSIHSKAIVMCNATTEPGRIPDVVKWFATRDDFILIFGQQ
jgi:hypothetical protein